MGGDVSWEDNSKASSTTTSTGATAFAGDRRERDGKCEMEVASTSPPNVHEKEKVLGQRASEQNRSPK